MNPIRVLLADDHTLIRAGLRMVVLSQPDFIVVGHDRSRRAKGHQGLKAIRARSWRSEARLCRWRRGP